MPDSKTKKRSLRRYLMTGLLVWVPLGVTFFVLRLLVNLVDQSLVLIPYDLRPEQLLGFRIPGLGLILAFLLLVSTGVFVANLLGNRIVAAAEALLGRVPFIGAVFRGSKQLAETLLAPESQSFRQVVLIRWPHHNSRAIAFVTGSSLGEVQEKTAEDVVAVFLPTTPNPTSGFILMVPRDDMIALDMSVDEAFRMIVSLGVVVPDFPRKEGAQSRPDQPGLPGLASAPSQGAPSEPADRPKAAAETKA